MYVDLESEARIAVVGDAVEIAALAGNGDGLAFFDGFGFCNEQCARLRELPEVDEREGFAVERPDSGNGVAFKLGREIGYVHGKIGRAGIAREAVVLDFRVAAARANDLYRSAAGNLRATWKTRSLWP